MPIAAALIAQGLTQLKWPQLIGQIKSHVHIFRVLGTYIWGRGGTPKVDVQGKGWLIPACAAFLRQQSAVREDNIQTIYKMHRF